MGNSLAIIVGPTCTGKTSLAIKLAKSFNGSIISADSRQVVRHMDIGTGKVPIGAEAFDFKNSGDRWVINGVDVFGYDLVNPNEYFSAYDFVNYCGEIFPRVSREGKQALLVGGTGLYIDVVTGRVPLEGIGPDPELRKSLELLSTDMLAEKLHQIDEVTFKNIDIKNPARLVRAIEKAVQRNRVPQRFEESGVAAGPRDENAAVPVLIGLTTHREILYDRADSWIDSIFGESLFDEVKMLQQRFPKSHRLTGIIYSSVVDYLAGKVTLDESKQLVKFAMHAYIRRQQTWFKRNPDIKWFDIMDKDFDSQVSSIVQSLANG